MPLLWCHVRESFLPCFVPWPFPKENSESPAVPVQAHSSPADIALLHWNPQWERVDLHHDAQCLASSDVRSPFARGIAHSPFAEGRLFAHWRMLVRLFTEGHSFTHQGCSFGRRRMFVRLLAAWRCLLTHQDFTGWMLFFKKAKVFTWAESAQKFAGDLVIFSL